MTMNVVWPLLCVIFFTEFGSFEASYVKVIEVRSTLCDKNLGQKSNLQQYMTYGDVFREY